MSIQPSFCSSANHAQRPVNWILWSFLSQTAVIVTLEEAESLIPILSCIEDPNTHLLTYAAPVTRKMLQFNRLNYYAIPSLPDDWQAPTWLTIELGLFAGRLFFEFNEYHELQQYLGLQTTEDKDEDNVEGLQSLDHRQNEIKLENSLGRIDLGKDRVLPKGPGFGRNPLGFVQDWLAVRRRGQEFLHTPMGFLCQGKPLTANLPFFRTTSSDNDAPAGTTEWNSDEYTAETEADQVEEDFYDAQVELDEFMDENEVEEEAFESDD